MRRTFIVALLASFGLWAPESTPAGGTPEPDTPSPAPETPDSGEIVADQILPSGLRVIVARDGSLPVAAVVLALEIGTRDDPAEAPGLVHGLAYHLQMGNRQLYPGEALATAHDSGGLANMAVGQAQIRYETLVPVARLDEMLRVESQRLRAPTISKPLWLKSLSYARSDRGQRALLTPEVEAAAWDDPGMAHDGRVVGSELAALDVEVVGQHLARLFTYERATLVVVSPRNPLEVATAIEKLFADLPSRARAAPNRDLPTGRSGPVPFPLPRQRGDHLVWPVAATHDARAWAQVLCATLNRQQRAPDEPKAASVRCVYKSDARRAALLVRARGGAPLDLVRARLERIAAGSDDELMAAQRGRVSDEIRHEIGSPLALALYLARTEGRSPTAGVDRVPFSRMVGLDRLGSQRPPNAELREVTPSLLTIDAALHLVAPGGDGT